ncbi:MAG: hypothetical protein IT285_03985 [Bdellovibrionales bacterium]|nr:hypothetical protein [Bdellovibrionales bacterium]
MINYWELAPDDLRARLDALQREGFSHVSSFVPWQAFESDISHKLMKFLQAVSERRLSLSLILSPDVGVHALHSGVPRDLAASEEIHARRAGSGPCVVALAPRWHALPSLHSAEFMKRYWAFLSRFLGFLSDLDRSQSGVLRRLSVSVTGSFWKYYRSPGGGSFDSATNAAGDEGKSGSASFLKYLSEQYSQREFADPDAAAAQRWKTQSFEDVNRRHFAQSAEDQFRRQSEQILLRKYLPVPLEHLELYTPEADPAYLHTAVLQAAADGRAEFTRLSKLVDACATRETAVDRRVCRPCVQWTGFGGFQTLSDSERQFLLLKSLLLVASRGGAVFLEDREWRRLSRSFRKRADLLARRLAEGRLRLGASVIQVVPHLWSPAGGPWKEWSRLLGPEARLCSSLDVLRAHPETKLVVVDPALILRAEPARELLDWAEAGGALVLPQGPLVTESARAQISTRLGVKQGRGRAIAGRGGASRQTYELGAGKVHFYDPQATDWRDFAVSLIEEAGIRRRCQLGDGRLQTISLESESGQGLFIMNGTSRALSTDIHFAESVRVTDLALSLTDSPNPGVVEPEQVPPVEPARRFSLEVPSCGVLPLSVLNSGTATAVVAVSSELPSPEGEHAAPV